MTDKIENYFSPPENFENFSEHWSNITSISCSSFIQNEGGLSYLELLYAWLTHCSIKCVDKRRDFFPKLVSKFENFLVLVPDERFRVYGFLLDAALGNARRNWYRDFKVEWDKSTAEKRNSDYIGKMGWASDRFQKHASKYFYPIYLNVGRQVLSPEDTFFLSGDFLKFFSSEDNFESYIKYILMGLCVDIFDMEKAFQIFLDPRVQLLAAESNIIDLFNLAKRLFAIGWRDEATTVTEFSTSYALSERQDYPFVIGEAEKLRDIASKGRMPRVKPSHTIQSANIERLSRR